MTRRLWFTAAAVAVAAVVSIPLAAQQAQGRGPGQRMGMAQGRGPGGPGMGMLRGIVLTDAQREQIRTIHEEAREAGKPAQMADLQKQLHLAILADSVDPQKVEQLKQSIAAAEAAALGHRIDVQARVAQVLTPEQRATARKTIETMERPLGRPGRGGGFGGPGRR